MNMREIRALPWLEDEYSLYVGAMGVQEATENVMPLVEALEVGVFVDGTGQPRVHTAMPAVSDEQVLLGVEESVAALTDYARMVMGVWN